MNEIKGNRVDFILNTQYIIEYFEGRLDKDEAWEADMFIASDPYLHQFFSEVNNLFVNYLAGVIDFEALTIGILLIQIGFLYTKGIEVKELTKECDKAEEQISFRTDNFRTIMN